MWPVIEMGNGLWRRGVRPGAGGGRNTFRPGNTTIKLIHAGLGGLLFAGEDPWVE